MQLSLFGSCMPASLPSGVAFIDLRLVIACASWFSPADDLRWNALSCTRLIVGVHVFGLHHRHAFMSVSI